MLAQRQMRVQQLVTNDYSINPVVARRDVIASVKKLLTRGMICFHGWPFSRILVGHWPVCKDPISSMNFDDIEFWKPFNRLSNN